MNQTDLITLLLAIIGFVGALGVKQLMNIAKSIGEIKVEIKGLTTDHSNLKEDHKELKDRVLILENKKSLGK